MYFGNYLRALKPESRAAVIQPSSAFFRLDLADRRSQCSTRRRALGVCRLVRGYRGFHEELGHLPCRDGSNGLTGLTFWSLVMQCASGRAASDRNILVRRCPQAKTTKKIVTSSAKDMTLCLSAIHKLLIWVQVCNPKPALRSSSSSARNAKPSDAGTKPFGAHGSPWIRFRSFRSVPFGVLLQVTRSGRRKLQVSEATENLWRLKTA